MSESVQLGLMPEFDQPPSEPLTKEQEYAAYINSPQWRRLRKQALAAAGDKCQKCGISKWSATLEVHHLTYERFKRERLSDLVVLCESCHRGADAERRQQVQVQNAWALENARFEGWAAKAYGESWAERGHDPERLYEQYAAWLERKGYE